MRPPVRATTIYTCFGRRCKLCTWVASVTLAAMTVGWFVPTAIAATISGTLKTTANKPIRAAITIHTT